MNKSKQSWIIALLLSVLMLCACGRSGPSEDEIGTLVLGEVSKTSQIKLALEQVKIITITEVSENTNEISVEIVLEAEEKLYKSLTSVQFGGDGTPHCDLFTVEIDKGDTVGGKAVVLARYSDDKWSYHLKDVTTGTPLSGSDYRTNITNLVSSPSEIEKAKGDVSYILTPESKTALLSFIGEKQLSDKQRLEAVVAEIPVLEKKAKALEQQYSVLEKEFRSAQKIENQKNETALKAFREERRAAYKGDYDACRVEAEKQQDIGKRKYNSQSEKLDDAYQAGAPAIRAEIKAVAELKYAKKISPAEYETKVLPLKERLAKFEKEHNRLKKINKDEHNTNYKTVRDASFVCYAEAKSKAGRDADMAYQKTVAQESNAILEPLIDNLNQIQAERNTLVETINSRRSQARDKRHQRHLDNLKSIVARVN